MILPLHFTRLPDLPVKQGLAGLFGGVSHGILLVAGGSNFPDKRPWEGGTKIWYDDIYGLAKPDGVWKKIGHLPMRLGYGISVTDHNRVICVGGSDKSGFHREVFSLEWKAGKIVTHQLPELPIPLSLCFGGKLGGQLIVGGGQTGLASKTASPYFFALDLRKTGSNWRRLPNFPGPARILAASSETGRDLWVCGGASLSPQRTYLRDAYRFDFRHGWKRLPNLPRPTLGAPLLTWGEDSFSILGGDDVSKLGFKPPEKHPGFSRWTQTYSSGHWNPQETVPFSAVLMPAIRWRGRWVLPGGESIPGVRTAQVWAVHARR